MPSSACLQPGLPLRLLPSGSSGKRWALRSEGSGQGSGRKAVKPRPLAELVERAGIQETRKTPVCETKAYFRTEALGLRREALSRSQSTNGVPEGTVASTLISVRLFMGADPRKQGVGQRGVESLERSEYWITKRNPKGALP